jgi:nucleotide-binding universal stress UspA family protein
MFNRILVGLDGSESSLNALDYAVHLARRDKADLYLVSASELIPSFAFLDGAEPSYIPKYQEELYKNLNVMVKQQIERLEATFPELKVKGEVIEGNAAHVIKEASKDSDLIVIGHRGQGGVLSWMLGSVAKQIVDECTVPVLVVKSKDYC